MRRGEFLRVLEETFGGRAREFSLELQDLLYEVYLEGFEHGVEESHTCGNFDPGSQGPVGPDGCKACQVLTGDLA